MTFNRLSEKTAALIQELRRPANRFGWLTGQEDQRPHLADEVAASGEVAAIPMLVDLLFDESPRLAVSVSDCIHHLLSAVAPRDLPAFDEDMRRYDCYWGSPERWFKLRPEAVPRLPKTLASRSSILGLASFHRSGYVREAAVRQLDLIEDGTEIPFLLLRLNDWVADVRGVAKTAIQRRLIPANLAHFHRSIHLVFRLLDWKRDDHEGVVRAVMGELVSPDHESALHELLVCEDRFVRRRCFRLAVELDGGHRVHLVLAGLHATDEVVRFWAARSARTGFQGRELLDALRLMEQDQFMPVRREALLGRIERQPEAATGYLEAALFDRSASIRELARFHLTKVGKSSFANVYRKAVIQREKIEVALLGLGETGSASDLHLIEPFVRDKRVAIRSAAVRALASLGGEESVPDLMASLQDNSKRVSSASKKGLERHLDSIEPVSLVSIALDDSRMHAQAAALHLLDQIPTWTAMPYLIQVAADRNVVLAEQAQRFIEGRYNRVFTNPRPDDRLAVQQAVARFGSALPVKFLDGLETWLRSRQ